MRERLLNEEEFNALNEDDKRVLRQAMAAEPVESEAVSVLEAPSGPTAATPGDWRTMPMPFDLERNDREQREIDRMFYRNDWWASCAAWRDMALKGIEREQGARRRRAELIGEQKPCDAGWECYYSPLAQAGCFYLPGAEDTGICPWSEQEGRCHKRIEAESQPVQSMAEAAEEAHEQQKGRRRRR